MNPQRFWWVTVVLIVAVGILVGINKAREDRHQRRIDRIQDYWMHHWKHPAE